MTSRKIDSEQLVVCALESMKETGCCKPQTCWQPMFSGDHGDSANQKRNCWAGTWQCGMLNVPLAVIGRKVFVESQRVTSALEV